MPGVHSDIGGVYPSRYLGLRALRSMIDRILAYTDLRFNRALLENLNELIAAPSEPHINNELTWIWRVLPKMRRTATSQAQNQYLHPVIREISGVYVAMRHRSNVRYDLTSFLAGAELPYFYDWHEMPAWSQPG